VCRPADSAAERRQRTSWSGRPFDASTNLHRECAEFVMRPRTVHRARRKVARQRTHQRSHLSRHLRMELLERRDLLAVVHWISDNDGNWEDAANWEDQATGNPRVPVSGDEVVIDRGAANPVITINAGAGRFFQDFLNQLISNFYVFVILCSISRMQRLRKSDREILYPRNSMLGRFVCMHASR